MANISVTQNDIGSVILKDAEFRDGELTLAAADSIAAGTILAVDSTSLDYVLFVKGGTTQGNGIPKVILTYPVTSTAAGAVPVRVAVSGKFRQERLVIDADGDNSNVDQAVIDQLRDYSLIPIDTQELLIENNDS